ncbi:ABC-2 family transporter protein (macronuclear) [Tetrahymena thermophila SB210]|uniref:ABC-2 family transporter protein n=1 Tax=Tetrahymena thermophila (strain SB210) TaxID=312017 RepID=Q22MH8_TETTS|nr:ABC-2 family transporter protein [Tetrahymena thermophila SB210]EAR86639.2 ABC-2 family transporter protein [Tetrahymena thermophila SB210]|eukprot:XP_977042.2 ABC-2 family transporter protein [Tetrahymena thermophila SB210]
MHLKQSQKVSPSNSLQAEKKSHSIDISFKNVSYSVIQKQGVHKNILKNLTGVMKSGEITAILGPSGGGKTSLLNILSGKIVNGKNISLTGQIMANGQTFSNQDFTKFSGYVMQNDILLDFFTVREAIQFAADLKVNGTAEKKKQRVNEIIKILKLERCQNTLIGGEHVKGISGGERKRVNIACELISDPQVLFLDEPTSGLDSFTSFLVIKLLKDYAQQQNKNVIMSIHSPNKDIWDLFDNAIFMSQGRFVYQGKAKNINHFFDQQGFFCPKNMCKPDYYMSQISATNAEKNPHILPGLFSQYDNQIECEMQESVSKIEIANKYTVNQYDFYQAPFLQQVKHVAIRNLIKIRRDPLILKSELIQTVFNALLFGLIFLNLNELGNETTLREINNRNGILFLDIMSMFMSGCMQIVISFPSERGVYMREENSKYYTPIAYAIGKISTNILLKIFYPIIYGTIVYFMVGYTHDYAYQYFIYISVLMLMTITGAAIGFTIGIAFSDIRTSTSITPAFLLPIVLFCGFFKRRADLATWIGWIQYISPLSYALEAIIRNEYRDFNSTLNPIITLDYEIGLGNCIWIMFILYAIFQSLSVIMLYVKRGSIQ